jgi:nucleoside-diphosphate-sugar epimerase
MRLLLLNSPGRFPTVVPEAGPWWDALAADGRFDIGTFSLNARWWEQLASPAIVARLADHRGMGELVDMFGPQGSLTETAAAAAAALGAFRLRATFEDADAYLAACGAIARHLANLASGQDELDLSLGVGPVVRDLDYDSSAAVAAFAHGPSLLKSTVEAALAALDGPPDLALFRITSPFDLASACVAAVVLRARFPGVHTALIDHGYENYSLEPHLDALKTGGRLLDCFDSIVASKDDMDAAVPRLAERLHRGEAVAGWLGREPGAKPPPRPPVAPPPRFETFSPIPVAHTRASPRRCYWSRCTFCTQNAKYATPGAPTKADIAAAVDRLAAMAAAGMDNVIFADEAISPAGLRLLSAEILRRGIAVKWACRAKMERSFDRALFDLAARAGCTEILFGLETTSQPLLRRMGKEVEGLDAAGTARILADLAAAGIGVHLNLINGFPGETLAEADTTADFAVAALKRHPNATYLLNPFTLFPGTPIADDPAAFGVAEVARRGDMPAAHPCRFDTATEATTAPARDRFGALNGRLHQGLGWAPAAATPAGRLAMDLYFSSGHSAVFKALPRNPLDPAAREHRRRTARTGPVLLTGATGVAGRAVLEALLAKGEEVWTLVRDPAQADPRCRAVVGDLAELDLDLSDAGAVIHCASPRSQDRETVMGVEIEGTARLVDAWRAGPFVGFSSQTVYGVAAGRLDERSPTAPGAWYDVGKLACEAAVAEAAGRDGRGAGVILRLPLLFGAGPRRRDRQFLPPIFDAVREGRTFVFEDRAALETHGSVFIGEEDLGRAALAALTVGRSGPYNLATGFASWSRLLAVLGACCGTAPRIAFRAGEVVGDDEVRLPRSRTDYDCTRFARASGFAPRQTLDEVVQVFAVAELRAMAPA